MQRKILSIEKADAIAATAINAVPDSVATASLLALVTAVSAAIFFSWPVLADSFPAEFELSSLDGSNGFVINGISSGDQAGYSVRSAGDVNGDGVDDLIIGAPRGTSGGQGKSYVVFGSYAGFPATVELTSLDGTDGFALNSNGFFGYSVSGAGDVNGDSIDDVIIGAYGARKAYVVFGRDTGFTATIDLSSIDGSNGFIVHAAGVSHLGESVSGAGDVNSDGIDDFSIGSRGADLSGSTYLVFGSDSGFPAILAPSIIDGSNGFVINGANNGDRAGHSISGAGDVNGDGVDDVIIGAVRADPNGNSDAGVSYVVFGSEAGFSATIELSSLDGINGFSLNGIDAGDLSGNSVSGAGDINGDGFDDVIIGAPYADPNGNSGTGQSYVVFGRASGFASTIEPSALDGINGFVINGPGDEVYAGAAVSGAGDVNSDGVDDLIIGAPGGTSGAQDKIYVVFGRGPGTAFPSEFELSSLLSANGGDGSTGFVLNGIDIGDYLGVSVGAAGDVNGDGIDDLIFGAYGASPNGNGQAGESYVVFGADGNEPATTASLRLDGVDDYLSLSDVEQTNLESMSAMTIEAWVYFNVLPDPCDFADIIFKGDAAALAYSFYLGNDDGSCGGGTGGYELTFVPGGIAGRREFYFPWTPATNTWYHVAVTYDTSSGIAASYINGASFSTVSRIPVSIGDNNSPVLVGVREINGVKAGYFDGLIDEVRVWNIERVASAIASDFNHSLIGLEPGLVAYWSFNNDFSDATSNNNDLTPNGGPVVDDSNSAPLDETYISNRLVIDAISDVTSGVSFDLTITEIDGHGIDGFVDLTLPGNNVIDPRWITLTDGTFTGPVAITGSSDNLQLTARRGNTSGISNDFSVVGIAYPEATAYSGGVFGVIPITVTITPELPAMPIAMTADEDGRFNFEDLLAGFYVVTGECGDSSIVPTKVILVTNGSRETDNLFCDSFEKTPVLIVPGILGSTEKKKSRKTVPTLPADHARPDQLKIFFPGNIFGQGVDRLVDVLEQNFNPIEVPWDWRVTMDEADGNTAWQKYLMRAIRDARDPDRDGVNDFEKVHVVAHSMGGLMVRAYIQSDLYRNDIDKFVTLGTPHLGATDAYFMSQGGDPEIADNLTGTDWFTAVDLRKRALRNAFTRYHLGVLAELYDPNQVAINDFVPDFTNDAIRRFVMGQVPTLRQLTPTYDFLEFFGDGQFALPLAVERNEFLESLNSDGDITRMGDDDPTLVRTKLFFSTNHDTLDAVFVADPVIGAFLYPDGALVDAAPLAAGDGTVLQRSARAEGTPLESFADADPPADLQEDEGEHSRMFGEFSHYVNNYLCPEGDIACQMVTAPEATSRSAGGPVDSLVIEVRSRNQLLVTADDSGLTSGVAPGSFAFSDDIPSAELSLGSEISGLEIAGPFESGYTVQIAGVNNNEPAGISVVYSNDGQEIEQAINLGGYFQGVPLTFQVVVDTMAVEPLTVNTLPMVQNLRRDNTSPTMKLLWDAPVGAPPAEYQVYGRALNRARFDLIGITTDLEFITIDPIVFTLDGTTVSYFVLAVDQQGEQSMFESLVTNWQPIIASFTTDVTAGTPPLTVNFMNESLGGPNGWAWDFDADGVIDSTVEHPQFVYNLPGTYAVTLTTTGPAGTDLYTAAGLIVVDDDTDSDGVVNALDNCTAVTNPDQIDADQDGFGNRCDADLDNSCNVNFADLALFSDRFFGTDPVADFDSSGSVNFADLVIIRAAFFAAPGPSGVDNICSPN